MQKTDIDLIKKFYKSSLKNISKFKFPDPITHGYTALKDLFIL